ncbi:MAG: hypothetical protein IJ499_00580, partial [Clostridia bacterium]|nr:hypothetical protein [Clostridia bacterium]
MSRFSCALSHHFFKVLLICNETVELSLNRRKRISAGFTYSKLKVAVALSFKFLFYLVEALS